MNFDSPIFLFAFLPIVVLAYHLVRPERWKTALLIAAGLLFYAFGDLRHLPLLLASCVLHYFVGRALMGGVRRRGCLLAGCVLLDFGVLLGFKLRGGTLPLGISFYTFQAVSYVADVYRDPAQGERRFRPVLQYLTFFPVLTAGPIMRFSQLRPYLDRRSCDWETAAQGVSRFVCGLAKKLLLSTAAAGLANAVFGCAAFDALTAWTGALAYCLQLYLDFSGYSDMAIGLALLFGVRLTENFNYPYCASSVADFWRRWHISLSGWFRDYLYIPLGGSRKGLARTLGNKLLVFAATGLWHGTGWTFLLWGLWHGLWSCAETALRLPEKLRGRWYGHLYALLIVIFGFVLFRAGTAEQGLALWRAMLTGFAPSAAGRAALDAVWSVRTGLCCVLGLVCCLPLAPRVRKMLAGRACASALRTVWTLALLALCLMQLAASGFQPFIYAQF